jgi:hypothetical protein
MIGMFDTALNYTFYGSLLHTHTHTHTQVSTVKFSLLLLGGGFQRRAFPFFEVPELSPASATNFIKKRLLWLNPNSLLTRPTHKPLNSNNKMTALTGPAFSISKWTVQKPPFLYCCLRASVYKRPFYSFLLHGRFLSTGAHSTILASQIESLEHVFYWHAPLSETLTCSSLQQVTHLSSPCQ